MNANPTLQQLLEVQAYFELPSPALVEKDFYVTRALAAIATRNIAPLRLVFGGGTSLCRAHRLICRMSEDIDLKIVSDADPTRFELRKLRSQVTDALLEAGFLFDPEDRTYRDSRNESRYTIFRLPYAPLLHGEGVLRPEIQIELVASPLYSPTVNLPLRSFVAEAFDKPSELSDFPCVSVTQTAAEKLVSLTRRTAAEIADARGSRDSTLVRHIYDLRVIRSHYDPKEVAVLAKTIIAYDAITFGNQFPAYRDDPFAETLRAIEVLRTDQSYADRYELFQRAMVYGQPVDFASALATLEELSQHIT